MRVVCAIGLLIAHDFYKKLSILFTHSCKTCFQRKLWSLHVPQRCLCSWVSKGNMNFTATCFKFSSFVRKHWHQPSDRPVMLQMSIMDCRRSSWMTWFSLSVFLVYSAVWGLITTMVILNPCLPTSQPWKPLKCLICACDVFTKWLFKHVLLLQISHRSNNEAHTHEKINVNVPLSPVTERYRKTV